MRQSSSLMTGAPPCAVSQAGGSLSIARARLSRTRRRRRRILVGVIIYDVLFLVFVTIDNPSDVIGARIPISIQSHTLDKFQDKMQRVDYIVHAGSAWISRGAKNLFFVLLFLSSTFSLFFPLSCSPTSPSSPSSLPPIPSDPNILNTTQAPRPSVHRRPVHSTYQTSLWRES